jgi:hypothetical protein
MASALRLGRLPLGFGGGRLLLQPLERLLELRSILGRKVGPLEGAADSSAGREGD